MCGVACLDLKLNDRQHPSQYLSCTGSDLGAHPVASACGRNESVRNPDDGDTRDTHAHEHTLSELRGTSLGGKRAAELEKPGKLLLCLSQQI